MSLEDYLINVCTTGRFSSAFQLFYIFYNGQIKTYITNNGSVVTLDLQAFST